MSGSPQARHSLQLVGAGRADVFQTPTMIGSEQTVGLQGGLVRVEDQVDGGEVSVGMAGDLPALAAVLSKRMASNSSRS